jgi:hypothetical protein
MKVAAERLSTDGSGLNGAATPQRRRAVADPGAS